MRALRFALTALARDARSGELAVLALSLVIAVAALTAVGFFASRIDRAVEGQAAEILAADLRVRSPRPLVAGYADEARRRGLETAVTVNFPSVVFHDETSSLVSLYAVSAGYPLRGRLRVADQPFGAGRVTDELPAPGEAWAESRLVAALGARVGDSLQVGALTLRLTRVLDYRPDQGSAFVDLASTLLVRLEDLPRTELLQDGSRATHALLLAGDRAGLTAYRDWLRTRLQRGERLTDVGEASPQVRRAADQSSRFLALAAMVTVLLAAVAVAMTARRYVQRHLDNVALMKCMGASQRFVLGVTSLQLLLAGLGAASAGILLGYGAQFSLAALLRDVVRADLPAPSLAPAWLGLGTTIAILAGFALPSLLTLRRVPPARVLRRDLAPMPLRHSVVMLAAAATLAALLAWILRDLRLVGAVLAGACATLVALAAAGWLLVRAAARLRGRVGVAWRYGIANVARRGTESVVQIVAFGTGLLVLLLLGVVRDDLLDAWRQSVPPDAPNQFLINIRPEDRAGLARRLLEIGTTEPEFFPMIRARITHVDDRPIETLRIETDRGRNFAEREQNLSWAERLQAGNRIVDGRWWSSRDRGRPLVSITTEYRDALGIGIGDRLTFDIAGERLTAEVASVREVRWDTFRPNFFLVFNPGTLEGMSGTFLTSLHLDAAQKRSLAGLAREFPSISIFDVDVLLRQIREVVDRGARAVQAVFVFTLVAGIMVLLAAVQSTRDERRFESAVLRTLGARRRVVLLGVAAEFIALGALAGLLAATAAGLGGWYLATRVFELPYETDLWLWPIGIVAGGALVGVSGALATRRAVTQAPLGILRSN